MGPDERRRAPRIALRIEAAYEDTERQVFLTTRDLSESGVYLMAPDPPQPGVAARVLLEVPGHAALLRLDGTVARCDEGAGFALRFDPERTSADARGALRALASGS